MPGREVLHWKVRREGESEREPEIEGNSSTILYPLTFLAMFRHQIFIIVDPVPDEFTRVFMQKA